MNNMEEDDDQWSYSFPASTDSLSHIGVKGMEELNYQSNTSGNNIGRFNTLKGQKPKSVSLHNSFGPSDVPDSMTTYTQKQDDIDSARGNHISEYNTFDYVRSETRGCHLQSPVNEKNFSMNSQQTLFFQSACISKSTPADPQTTKRDASSIISKENASNALVSITDSPGLPPSPPTPKKDLRSSLKYWQQNSIEEAVPPHDVKQVTGSNKVESASPKIITYRKTTHVREISNTLKSGEHEKAFDPKLYVSDCFKDTGYRYATMKRNVEFHQVFKTIDLTDRLLDDFACAISREILLQGRVYITENHLCFNSNLLGWVTSLVIPHSDILRIDKKSTAGLFPNAISVDTRHASHNFASFLSRDSTFDFLRIVWSAATDQDLSKLDSHPVQSFQSMNNSERRISDYILSIDEGDNVDNEWNDEALNEIEIPTSESTTSKLDVNLIENSPPHNFSKPIVAKIIDFKQDSAYKHKGPNSHSPTIIPVELLKHHEEIEVIKDVIKAPLGIVCEILFGQNNNAFHRNFLVEQGATEISDYGSFQQCDDISSKMERCYNYQRPLGYSIGPKATKCYVKEVFEHYNPSEFVIVSSTTDTPDVPSGGSFSVITRYYLNWGENNTTELRISYFVKWTSRSWIRSMVEKSTLSAQNSVSERLLSRLKHEIEAHTQSSDEPPVSTPSESIISKSTSKISSRTNENAAQWEKDVAMSIRRDLHWFIASLLILLFVIVICVQWKLANFISELQELLILQKEVLKELSLLMQET